MSREGFGVGFDVLFQGGFVKFFLTFLFMTAASLLMCVCMSGGGGEVAPTLTTRQMHDKLQTEDG